MICGIFLWICENGAILLSDCKVKKEKFKFDMLTYMGMMNQNIKKSNGIEKDGDIRGK